MNLFQMNLLKWIKGILLQRGGRIAGAVAGVALTMSLLSSIGFFTAYSGKTMTERALRDNPVDWQVQLAPGTDPQKVIEAIKGATKYTALMQVGYADVQGIQADTGGTIQTTGAGKVLGIGNGFSSLFPGQIRYLTGAAEGVLLAQQTAANLHAGPGDTVTILRNELSPVKVKIDGVVDLPNADSLFQAVGLPSTAAPQAPPDNVILLPEKLWHDFFDQQVAVRPDSVKTQLHARIDHNLPADPYAALIQIQQMANNLEAKIAGSGTVGDNISARLSAVKGDAFYAKILFLFLGLPGAILAALLVIFVLSSGREHRRKEQALLRIHGASSGQILGLQSVEGILVGIGGILLGVLASVFISRIFLNTAWRPDNLVSFWIIASALAVFVLALVSVAYPVWKDLKHAPSGTSKNIRRNSKPVWQLAYLDMVLLVISGIEFWRTASTGYQVVLAPEGVTAISVNYEAFIAPFCLWVGGVLLSLRIYHILLKNGKNVLSMLIRPMTKGMSPIVSASLTRDRRFLAAGSVLVALAVSFAVSVSIFNTTYNMQSRVDAELTNGSDVTVTGLVPFVKGDGRIDLLKTLPGVTGMQLMQHRFAYVGNDLQDIYGIDPGHIGDATSMSNAYFGNKNAAKTLTDLANNRDGVLVSEETVKDFQLQLGDTVNLRIQNATDHQYHIVPFRFVGTAREFPTAPLDSFLVANADYISEMSGNNASEVVLLKSSGSTEGLANDVKKVLGDTGVKVSDIGSVQKIINSSLTSVDLHGLTSIELAFAVLLLAGAMGLVLALGLSERKRNFAILRMAGADRRQVDLFLWSECLIMFLGGSIAGAALGVGIAQMLVKVLTGVFDPPPEFLAVPWGYLGLLALIAAISAIAAVYAVKTLSGRAVVEELRSI